MPFTALGAGLLSAGASLAGNLLGFASNERTNKQSMELAKYQNQWNLDMWNKQNEYNSPVKQMERLQEAGLNPNLIYGTGVQAAGNNSHASAAASTPTLGSYNNFGDLGAGAAVQSYQAQVQLNNQTELAKSQVDLNAARTVSEKKDQALKDIQQIQSLLDVWKDKKTYPILVQIQKQNLKNLELVGEQTSVQTNNLLVSRNEMAARIDEIGSRIKVNEKTLDEIQSRIGLNRAQSYLAYQNAVKAIAEAAYYGELKKGKSLDNEYLKKTLPDRVNKVSADLFSALLSNDRAEFELLWMKEFGLSRDEATQAFNTAVFQLRTSTGETVFHPDLPKWK